MFVCLYLCTFVYLYIRRCVCANVRMRVCEHWGWAGERVKQCGYITFCGSAGGMGGGGRWGRGGPPGGATLTLCGARGHASAARAGRRRSLPAADRRAIRLQQHNITYTYYNNNSLANIW